MTKLSEVFENPVKIYKYNFRFGLVIVVSQNKQIAFRFLRVNKKVILDDLPFKSNLYYLVVFKTNNFIHDYLYIK